MELRPGTAIDRYVLAQKLGEGGQGAVWRAEDRLQPGRELALKLVPLASSDGSQVERVRREARHLARLQHPGLPACHALFEELHHGLLVVAMELVQGPTLTEAASSLAEGQRGAVLRQVASVLAYLHGAGVVHRDVKPDNVILTPSFWSEPLRQGSVKLIDLGISVSSGNPSPLTVVGHIIGTSSFLAPEILDPPYFPSPQDTPAADVFAFGVLAWWLLTGRHPTALSEGATMASYALAYRQADQVPRWPEPAGLGAWEGLLRRCLAVRARERFASATELLSALTAEDAGLTTARPPGATVQGEPVRGATRLEPIAERVSSLPGAERASWPGPERASVAPTPAPVAATPLPATRIEPRASITPRALPQAHQPLPAATTAPGDPLPSATTAPAAPLPTAHDLPAPAPLPTVSAAPLPVSFRDEPSRSSGLPPPHAPLVPVPVPVPAAPAPAPLAPAHTSRRRASLPARPAGSPLLRYLLAALLLLFGGAAAFVLTIVIVVLIHLGR